MEPTLGMEPSERRALEIFRIAGEQSDEIASLQRALDDVTERWRTAMHEQAFKVGDRIHHKYMDESGVVDEIKDNGAVHVTYDRIGNSGKPWVGEYDGDWFRIHPKVLLKA